MRLTTVAGLFALALAVGLAIASASPPADAVDQDGQRVIGGEIVGTPAPQNLASSSSTLPLIGASSSAVLGVALLGISASRRRDGGGGL